MRVMDAADKDMTYEKMAKIWLPMQLEPGKSTRDQPSVTKSVYTWFGLHPWRCTSSQYRSQEI